MTDRNHFVCFRFSDSELAALDARAKRSGCSRSTLIRLHLLEVITPDLHPFSDPNQIEMFPGASKRSPK